MTIWSFLSRLALASVVGAVLTIPLSGDDIISLETWLTLTAVVMALRLLVDLFRSAQVEPARISVAWTWRRGQKLRVRSHPARELRAIKGTLASAQFNPRSFANRLRPRLEMLAKHFLPIRRGVDPETEPARTEALLGDVAWILDREITDRTPTFAELDQFLDVVLGEHA